MASKPILFISDEEKCAIRKSVNILSEERLQSDIDSVLEWFKKEQHLPRIELDRNIVECIIISRKGSVEQTKHKIDMMYSLKNIIPDMAAPRDVLHPRIQKGKQGCKFVTLPKLNHDLTRINIVKIQEDSEFFNLTDLLNYVITTVEYRLLHDCFSGERFLVDLQHLSFNHMLKVTPTVIKYAELYIRQAYGLRIFGIHLINASNLLNNLLTLLKASLSEKLSSRINAHSTYEDVFNFIDKNILPEEYGGNERSMELLIEDWQKELSKEDVREYLIKQESLRSNEAVRIGSRLDNDLLGIAGSFRKLEVD